MKNSSLLLLNSLACGALISACGGSGAGSTTITSDLAPNGTHSFNFQTAYAWIHTIDASYSHGHVVLKHANNPTLELRLSGAKFDPTADLRFVGAEQLSSIQLGQKVNGILAVGVTNYDKGIGAAIASDARTHADQPRISEMRYTVALHALSKDSTFPSSPAPYGTRTTAVVTVKKVGLNVGDDVTGSIALRFERDGDDPANALTGTTTIEFDAPLISQRIAECNDQTARAVKVGNRGTVDACEIATATNQEITPF